MTTNPTPLTVEEWLIDRFAVHKSTFPFWKLEAGTVVKCLKAYATQQNAELAAKISKLKELNSDIIKDFNNLQAENERLKQQLEWQPIETAPKDRTEILLYGGAMLVPAIITIGFWYEGCKHWDVRDDSEYTGFVATHWMPLPQPPKEAT